MTTMGIKIHKEWPQTQGRLERSEIMEAIRKLRLGKVPGLDGITAKMLKYGGEITRLDGVDMHPSMGAK